MKLQDKFAKFMYGRNGLDLCNKVIMVLYLIAMILAVFMPNVTAAYVFVGIALALAVLFLFRTMSKNLGQRGKENEFCYRIRDNIKKELRLIKNKWRDRKTHVYKKCPKCKAVLRLKRAKGKHTCNCPHCGEKVEVNVHIAKKS